MPFCKSLPRSLHALSVCVGDAVADSLVAVMCMLCVHLNTCVCNVQRIDTAGKFDMSLTVNVVLTRATVNLQFRNYIN